MPPIDEALVEVVETADRTGRKLHEIIALRSMIAVEKMLNDAVAEAFEKGLDAGLPTEVDEPDDEDDSWLLNPKRDPNLCDDDTVLADGEDIPRPTGYPRKTWFELPVRDSEGRPVEPRESTSFGPTSEEFRSMLEVADRSAASARNRMDAVQIELAKAQTQLEEAISHAKVLSADNFKLMDVAHAARAYTKESRAGSWQAMIKALEKIGT